MIHHLKTLAEYYDAVKSGDKTFEVRKDDRGFQKGDTLILHRFTKMELEDTESHWWLIRPTPRMRVTVTYVLTGGQYGIEPGYVVLGIKAEET